MTERELEELQSRIAHQELAIETLNDTVVRQARQLEVLARQLDEVVQRVRELRPSPLDSDPASEPPPPHY